MILIYEVIDVSTPLLFFLDVINVTRIYNIIRSRTKIIKWIGYLYRIAIKSVITKQIFVITWDIFSQSRRIIINFRLGQKAIGRVKE